MESFCDCVLCQSTNDDGYLKVQSNKCGKVAYYRRAGSAMNQPIILPDNDGPFDLFNIFTDKNNYLPCRCSGPWAEWSAYLNDEMRFIECLVCRTVYNQHDDDDGL